MVARDAPLDYEPSAVDRALPADRIEPGPVSGDLRRARRADPEARLEERPRLPRARGLRAGLDEQAEAERARPLQCLYFFSLPSFSLLCGFSFFFAQVW